MSNGHPPGPDFSAPGSGWTPPGGSPLGGPPPGPPPPGPPRPGPPPPGPPRWGWVPPGPPPGRSGGSIWLGIGIGLVALVASFFGAQWLSPFWDMSFAMLLFSPIVLIVVGIVLAANPRTRRTGGGILIGVGSAVLILGGLCIALIAGLGGVW